MTQFFTSIAANYLPKARVLARTVKQHHPEATMVLVLTDTKPDSVDWSKEPFDRILCVDELDIPNWKAWLFGMRLVESCTAVKPFALKKLLRETNEPVIYLDPDIAVFTRLTPILDALKTSSVLLTPHICVPEETVTAIIDNEICTLKHGLYNLGFVAVAPDKNGLAYADWWADRCYSWCRDDIPNGLFTDQRWNDFAPIFFDNVRVMKNPGLNVATWNYTHRKIEGTFASGFTVNGEPLYFHHFTGYDSGAHEHMRNIYGKDMPAAMELSLWYEKITKEADADKVSRIPWAFTNYDNGVKITEQHRNIYRTRGDIRDVFPDPYSCEDGKSFYRNWLLKYFFIEQKMDAPMASAIIVTHNSERVIGQAIESLMKYAHLAECFVVDNASTDMTCGIVRKLYPHVRVIQNDRNLGFGHACNQAAREVSTPYVLFINPDARLHEDTMPKLVEAARNYPEAGIIAPQLVGEKGQPYFSFRRNIFHAERHHSPLSHADGDCCADFITGAIWMVNTQKFRDIGGFDTNFFLYCEDDDICLRMQEHKHSIIVVADAYATHIGSASSSFSLKGEWKKGRYLGLSKLYLYRKYHEGSIGKRMFIRMIWNTLNDIGHYLKRLRFGGVISSFGRLYSFVQSGVSYLKLRASRG